MRLLKMIGCTAAMLLSGTTVAQEGDAPAAITQNGPEVQITSELKIGDDVPTFTLPTLDGQRINFPQDFAGKVVIVNFWATWCSPCVEEIPSLERLRRQLKGSDVAILTININEGEQADVAALLDKSQAHFMTALDPGGPVSIQWGTAKLPETYIVDKSGKLHSKIIGAQVWDRGDRVNQLKTLE